MAVEGCRLPLALTRGDPSGVGIEIALKAWAALHGDAETAPFFMIADPGFVEASAKALRLDVPVRAVTAATAAQTFSEALPVLPLEGETFGEPGKPDARDGAATIASMRIAVEQVAAGEAAAVVTNPVSKAVLYQAGFKHPGQTEYMGEQAQRLYGTAGAPVMLLWSSTLAVVPATIHVPLADVPDLVTGALVEETVRIVARDYQTRFGIERPRIAVTGLNPHAGENGDMGRQEIEIIAPAIACLAAEGYAVTGPHPADTMFHAAARARYDVAVTMYHDQALIPIKTLAFDSGVNVTLGLPFVRTSPDHGTAFDIAGRGIADPSSLVAALQLAGRLTHGNRAACPAR